KQQQQQKRIDSGISSASSSSSTMVSSIDSSSTTITTATLRNDDNSDDDDDDNDMNNKNKMIKNSEMLCSLLEMMKMSSTEEFAKKLCFMSESPLLCQEMRNCGYVPMLIRLIHQQTMDDHDDFNLEQLQQQQQSRVHRNLIQALNNIVQHTKRNRKELKILKILEDLKAFVEILLKKFLENQPDSTPESVDHPCNLIIDLYKMCSEQQSIEFIEYFGGVFVISEVIKIDYKCHGDSHNEDCYKIRLYSLMILTHVTFNNPQVKSLLGSKKSFLIVLIELLRISSNEDLIQAIAKVIQNLSWDTNYISMQTMRDVKTVTHLTNSMLIVKKESTIKCLLAALGNLTASSPQNKADFCRVNGGLEFLIKSMKITSNDNDSIRKNTSPDNNNSCKNTDNNDNKISKLSISVVEASGRILRNISSYLATEEKYRQILREHNVILMLLNHLESSSLDVVSNACVILSNLSVFTVLTEESSRDQILMIESNAITKLAKLIHSKHRTIREGAMATYKHLVTSHAYLIHSSFNNDGQQQQQQNQTNNHHQRLSTSLSISSFPMRKMKAIKNEIANLSTLNNLNNNNNDEIIPIDLSKSFNFGSSNHNRSRFSRSTSHDSIRRNINNNGQTIIMTKSTPDSSFVSASYQHQHHHLQQQSNNNKSNRSSLGNVNRKSTITTRITCDNNNHSSIISDGISSDYDIYSGDSKCQIPINNQTLGNNNNNNSHKAFIHQDETSEIIDDDNDELDYTTDFSERYKDDEDGHELSGRHHHHHHHSHRNRSGGGKPTSESVGEDSVKIYETEGTPLAFSLAPSLSDLHDIDLKSIYEDERENEDHLKKTKPKLSSKVSNTSLENNVDKTSKNTPNNLSPINLTSTIKLNRNVSRISSKSIDESNKKPILPPKPSSSTTTTTNDVIDRIIRTDKNNNNTRWNNDTKSTNENDHKTTDAEYFNQDSAIKFETEDTPAIFSHATSLSSLNVDDNDDDDNNQDHSSIVEQTTINVSITSNVEQSIGDDDDDDVTVMKSNDNDKDDKQMVNKCNENIVKEKFKENHCDDDFSRKKDSHDQQQQQSSSSITVKNETIKKSVSEDDDDDEDEQILKKCIEFALPTKKKSIKSSSSSSSSSTPKNSSITDTNNRRPLYNQQNNHHKSPRTNNNNNNNKQHSSSVMTKNSSQISIMTMNHQNNSNVIGQQSISSQQQSPLLRKSLSKPMIDVPSSGAQSVGAIGDQRRQFFVEDTPIQFSECHSSLSSLSFDSDNGIGNTSNNTATDSTTIAPNSDNNSNNNNNNNNNREESNQPHPPPSTESKTTKPTITVDDDVDDYQLLDAVINLGINSNVNTSSSASSGQNHTGNINKTTGIRSSSVVSTSSSMSHRQRNLANVAKTTKIQSQQQQQQQDSNQNVLGSLPKIHHNNVDNNFRQTSSNSGPINNNRSSRSMDRHYHHHQHHHHHDDNFDDDEKTYIICTQVSRESSSPAATTYPQRQSADGQSSNQCQSNVKNSPRKPKRDNTATNRTSPANHHKNVSKIIPIPTTRTTILNKNNQHQQQLQPTVINGNGDHSDTGSFDDRSAHSLLDNTKPPSIIDHHSLMSQSSASSIDSEISDIGIDNIPLRKSNSQDLLVAKAASNCAKEINTLVQSCVNDDDDDSSVKDSSSSLSTADGYHHHHHHSKFSSINDNQHSLMKTYNPLRNVPQQVSRTLPKMKPIAHHSNQTEPKQKREINKSSKVNTDDDDDDDDEMENGCDQRTYNKNDLKRNKNDQPIGYNYYESDQSDTDISEILPLDDYDPCATIISNNSTNPIDSVDGQTTTTTTTTNESNTATIVLYNKPNIDPNPSINDPFLAQMLSTSPQTAAAATAMMMNNKTRATKSLSSSSSTTMKHSSQPKSSASVHSFSHHNNNNNNSDESYGGHQLERLEDLESETRYRPNSRNRNNNNTNDRMEELDFTNGFNQQFNSFNQHHHHDRSLNFVQNSRSLQRGHKFMIMNNNTKADFEDRDMMFTSKHRKQVVQSHARYFQNKSSLSSSSSSSTVKTSSKYFDRHPIVGADAETNNEIDLLLDSPPRLSTTSTANHPLHHHHVGHSPLLSKQQQQQQSNNDNPTVSIKSKEKSLLSNIKSKLFSSPKPSKKHDNNNVKSKIKFWPRSKSTHDKLDQQQSPTIETLPTPALPLNQRHSLKTSASVSGGSQEFIDKSSVTGSMFDRLIPTRRSLANHHETMIMMKTNLTRSTTYDSLPIKDVVDDDNYPNQLSMMMMMNRSNHNISTTLKMSPK
uniref:Probable WRKY transcription factor protein 1 n=1 Tax=Dermatophagoides pteronyssinus TaxID=6956 RepID=A0A6P6XT17_DERPT